MSTNDYGNVSEYFRTLLREARAREEHARLETLLVEGLASGDEIPLTKEFWKELKNEAAGIARKHRARLYGDGFPPPGSAFTMRNAG